VAARAPAGEGIKGQRSSSREGGGGGGGQRSGALYSRQGEKGRGVRSDVVRGRDFVWVRCEMRGVEGVEEVEVTRLSIARHPASTPPPRSSTPRPPHTPLSPFPATGAPPDGPDPPPRYPPPRPPRLFEDNAGAHRCGQPTRRLPLPVRRRGLLAVCRCELSHYEGGEGVEGKRETGTGSGAIGGKAGASGWEGMAWRHTRHILLPVRGRGLLAVCR
jgi:hypothetical protein